MKKADLMNYIGKYVEIVLFDNTKLQGLLGFSESFSAIYDWRKPQMFFIDNYNFKVSHVKKLILK